MGDTLLLTGIGKSGFKIRSVPLVGIVDYNNESMATDFISYADVNTVRILMGLTLGNDEDTPVTSEQKSLLEASGDELFGGETVSPRARSPPRPQRRPRPRLRDRSRRPIRGPGTSSWPESRTRRPPPRPSCRSTSSSRRRASTPQAAGWKEAAGPFASSIDVVRVVFNIAIIIVAVVASSS